MASKKQKRPTLNTCGHSACVQSFIDTGKSQCLYAKTKLYLYRTLDNDDDGDPRDHGVLRAASRKDACEMLGPRFASIGLGPVTVVRLYHVVDDGSPRVLPTENVFSDHPVKS